jgi:glutathione S-transferase
MVAALDRLEAELAGREYLTGDGFTVADLTAAALLYPLVLPAEGPRLNARPATLASFRQSLAERRAFRWVEETFRRHRRRGASRMPPDRAVATTAP